MIGSRIRQLRLARGWRLDDLATRSGVAAPNISRIERGEVDPRLSTVERLLAALDVKLTIGERASPTPIAEVVSRAERGKRALQRAGVSTPDPMRRLARRAARGEDVRAEAERLEALNR